MMDDALAARIRDEEHLKLLSLFFYVSGGIGLLYGLFPLIYVFMGLFFMAIAGSDSQLPDEAGAVFGFMGMMTALIGVVMTGLLLGLGLLKILSGWCIAHRRHRVLSLVVGAVCWFGIPYSTILGICTWLVLARPSVIALYEREAADRAALRPD